MQQFHQQLKAQNAAVSHQKMHQLQEQLHTRNELENAAVTTRNYSQQSVHLHHNYVDCVNLYSI
jgi:hypothetical protein